MTPRLKITAGEPALLHDPLGIVDVIEPVGRCQSCAGLHRVWRVAGRGGTALVCGDYLTPIPPGAGGIARVSPKRGCA